LVGSRRHPIQRLIRWVGSGRMAHVRGSLRRLPSGSWEIRLFLGTDDTGKKRYRSKSVKGSKREAERTMRQLSRGQPIRTNAHDRSAARTLAGGERQRLEPDYRPRPPTDSRGLDLAAHRHRQDQPADG
jgi:hypothetical protein